MRMPRAYFATSGWALDHLRRGRPGRPFRFATDIGLAVPQEALPAHIRAVAGRLAVALDAVDEVIRVIDDDRPRRLVGFVIHGAAKILPVDLVISTAAIGNFLSATAP